MIDLAVKTSLPGSVRPLSLLSYAVTCCWFRQSLSKSRSQSDEVGLKCLMDVIQTRGFDDLYYILNVSDGEMRHYPFHGCRFSVLTFFAAYGPVSNTFLVEYMG